MRLLPGKTKLLPKSFYERDTAIVAKELLGKILVRRIKGRVLKAKIVETEAYYGERDPASRAFKGGTRMAQPMFGSPGKTFVYMVHNNWLLNIVTEKEGMAGAVLIRAAEPLQGIKVMKENRGIDEARQLTNGPGKMTKAMAITKEQNGIYVTNPGNELVVAVEGGSKRTRSWGTRSCGTQSQGTQEKFRVAKSHRIGVARDLSRKLRFYVKGNKFVSR